MPFRCFVITAYLCVCQEIVSKFSANKTCIFLTLRIYIVVETFCFYPFAKGLIWKIAESNKERMDGGIRSGKYT